jgi:hypothetical protein
MRIDTSEGLQQRTQLDPDIALFVLQGSAGRTRSDAVTVCSRLQYPSRGYVGTKRRDANRRLGAGAA